MVTPPRGGQYHDNIMVLIEFQNSLTLTKISLRRKKCFGNIVINTPPWGDDCDVISASSPAAIVFLHVERYLLKSILCFPF